MSTHRHAPKDTYICSNPRCRHTAASPTLCPKCKCSMHLNPNPTGRETRAERRPPQ